MSHRFASVLLTAALLCPGWAALAHAAPEGPAPTREELSEENTPGELDTRQPCEPPDATTSQLSESVSRRGSAAAPEGVDPRQHQHARRMYLIGEQCRRNGDYHMAQNCYEETRLICLASDYARQAEGRLRRLEALRDAVKDEPIGEEQEPAKEAQPKEEDYNIQLSVPRLPRTGRLESPEALKARMDQEIKRLEAQETKTEEEAPFACPCMPSGLFHETTEDLYKLTAAHTLYRIGERCRRNGDPEMARNCYEEAHLICPECRYGRLAIRRLAVMDSRKSKPSTESGMPQSRSEARPTPSRGGVEPTIALLPTLPPVDPNVVPAFNRLLAETAEPPMSELVLVRQVVRTRENDCEEQSGVTPCGGLFPQTEPPSLQVEVPCRDLVLTEEKSEKAAVAADPSDLSDWLRETVRVLNGAGAVRVEVTRLGRLMAQGEAAVRALGCAIVHEGGRSFVVYPAPR